MFDRIEAPSKELVVVEADCHLLFNEALDEMLAALLPRLLNPAPPQEAPAPPHAGR